jgi:tripartite-type tricarboxylate transporter receptor subunit TctC
MCFHDSDHFGPIVFHHAADGSTIARDRLRKLACAHARTPVVAIFPRAGVALVALLAAAAPCVAASYPTKPITLVVPFAAGGTNDILARAIGRALTAGWGQPVVIDNRAGAGGTTGIISAAKAAPDGYTLLLVSSTFTINPAMRTKLPFDPVEDFTPVALIGRGPMVLAASRMLPVNSVADLVALARAKPGAINYASAGPGSVNHIAAELLNVAAGIRLVHVPYRGGSLAINDLMAGHVDLYVSSMPQIVESVRGGLVKGLAVTGTARSPAAPELPTMGEAGVAGYEMELWWGIVAPAGTPQDVVMALNHEINRALVMPDMTAFLEREGAAPAGRPPAQFGALIAAEFARWRKVAREADIHAE